MSLHKFRNSFIQDQLPYSADSRKTKTYICNLKYTQNILLILGVDLVFWSNRRDNVDVDLEVAYSCVPFFFFFFPVSDFSTCPDIRTRWCYAGIFGNFEIGDFKSACMSLQRMSYRSTWLKNSTNVIAFQMGHLIPTSSTFKGQRLVSRLYRAETKVALIFLKMTVNYLPIYGIQKRIVCSTSDVSFMF